MAPDDALDDPVGTSLRGRHAAFSLARGRAATYAAEVATFSAVPLAPAEEDWLDLAALLGADRLADLFSSPATPPPHWPAVFSIPGVQMVADGSRFRGAEPDPDVVRLVAADVPAMLQLANEARPGPFWRRTPELGRYVGVRVDGRLVAMAGERLSPPGWTEISAVSTTASHRGRGLARRLVRDLAGAIVARGDRPFLHVAADNTAARALYDRLGFEVRREVTFRGYRTPDRAPER